MKVNVEQLESVWIALISNIKSKGIKDVNIDESYYWSINDGDLYNVYRKPEELTIGDLTDEWTWLLRMANEPDDANIYAFRWLSEVLRGISIKQPEISSEQPK